MPALLLTRPIERSHDFAKMLGIAVRIEISPVIKIIPAQSDVNIKGYDAVIFTSSTAIRMAGQGHKAWCVGMRTTQQARAAGFDAHMAGADVAEMVKMLRQTPPQTLLYLRGKHITCDLITALPEHRITQQVIYDQQCVDLTPKAKALLNNIQPVLVPLFSLRSARLLFMQHSCWQHHIAAAISPRVAKLAISAGFSAVHVAKESDVVAMVDLVRILIETIPDGQKRI